jgi:dipeptidyl aminopeptidase/acylaminoacyl peptidase
MTNVQLLAGLGYAVLTPALPGTGPDGPSAHLTDSILATLDAALAQNPELDGDRVGYVGHSFGGFTGLVLAAETRRIRSFVILSAPSNLASEWGSFGSFLRENPEFGHTRLRRNVGWGETGQGGLGGPPWDRPEAYTDNSPLFRADRIASPVLMIHGDSDFVGVNEAETMFTALWRQNKDVQLVTYWGEPHLFASPGTVRDLWVRLDAWFARTIGLSPSRLTPSVVVHPTGGSRPPQTRPQESPRRPPANAAHPHPTALP